MVCWVSRGPAMLGVENYEGGFCDESDPPGVDRDVVEQPKSAFEQGVRAFARSPAARSALWTRLCVLCVSEGAAGGLLVRRSPAAGRVSYPFRGRTGPRAGWLSARRGTAARRRRAARWSHARCRAGRRRPTAASRRRRRTAPGADGAGTGPMSVTGRAATARHTRGYGGDPGVHEVLDAAAAAAAAARPCREELAPARPDRVTYRGAFAYAAGILPDGEQIPLCRLRYGGSAHSFGFAIHSAVHDRYQETVLLHGSRAGIPQDAPRHRLHRPPRRGRLKKGPTRPDDHEPPTNLQLEPLRVASALFADPASTAPVAPSGASVASQQGSRLDEPPTDSRPSCSRALRDRSGFVAASPESKTLQGASERV